MPGARRTARPVRVVAIIGCALRRGLPACGCGPADLVAAPRPEGFRPGGRGRPPAPESASCLRPRPALARPPRRSAQYPDALALPASDLGQGPDGPSTRTLQEIRSVLKRSITRAQARDKVKRNVVLLCEVPQGRTGRPSKSLTLAQAEALLEAAKTASLHAYIVVSLLTGARTEELRPLTWAHVDLDDDPPSIRVWRSVRAGGETKTKKSRRTLALPQRCVDVLRDHQAQQEQIRKDAGDRWQDNDLVFPSRVGTQADASHVRRSFRKVVAAAGLNPDDWTPRELRHSFVSLLSDAGLPIEQISRLVGHSGDGNHRDGLPEADPAGHRAWC